MGDCILQKFFIYSVILLIALGFFASPLSFADSHEDGGDKKYSDDGDTTESGDYDKYEDSSYPVPDVYSKKPLMVIPDDADLMGLTAEQKKLLEQHESLEKERIQLEKEQDAINQERELLRIQMFNLSLTIEQLKNNDVSPDKIKELEEQLEELEFDQDDINDSQIYLNERKDTYEKNLKILQDNPLFRFVPMPKSVEVKSESTSIPPWFKSNAKWWKQGLISDGDIINALETLIIQDVIPLEKFAKPHPGLEHEAGVPKGGTFILKPGDAPTIPSYQKDVFGFWSDGLVSDSEIVNSIGHLMTEGIINSEKIQTEISQRQSERYEETDEWDENMAGEKYNSVYDARVAIFFPDNLPGEFKDNLPQEYYDEIEFEILECNLSSCSDSIIISEPVESVEGGMEQLVPVTVLSLNGINFPISQFTLWKWTGECDDMWHYHTPAGHAIAVDGITGISDPDQENCGFGKVGYVFVNTWFMSQSEIDRFKDRTNTDPLQTEPMMGGSDTGSNSVSEGPGEQTLEEELEELKNKITPYDGPKLSENGTSKSAFLGDEFADSDGDGIEDAADPEPEIPNNEFGGEKSESGALIGKIIDRGDLTVTIHDGGNQGVSIEVSSDGDSKSVIVEIMGVELEIEAGTILEGQFR